MIIIMGVVCILIGLLGIWLGIIWYQKAQINPSYFKRENYETYGDISFIIGIVTLLSGVFFIIANFIII